MGLSEQVAEAFVLQGPVRQLHGLPGLWFFQTQLELPQGTQLFHELPLARPTGLEVQLQVQRGACWLLS